MLRISLSIVCCLIAGCMPTKLVGQPRPDVYLDLIAIEGGQSKYPDAIRSGLLRDRPATLRNAVEALRKIVPAQTTSDASSQDVCSGKASSDLSETYQGCKYAACKLLPERSRIQDCGYFVRLEQWVQREWLGALCSVDPPDKEFPLSRWFLQRSISDCSAMSELVMIAYMRDLVGLGWSESQLLVESSE